MHRKYGLCQSSPLDVYRNLFTTVIGREGLKDYVSIRMKDGSSYKISISARQAAWYNGVTQEEKEDVALLIAATMFQEQILVAYLNYYPDFNPATRIKNVTSMKHQDGGYAYRITFNDGYTAPAILMSADENYRFRSLQPDDRTDFLMNLAIHHLTNDTAQDLVKRIKASTQSQFHVNTLPLRRQDYTPEIISAISSNLALIIARFNVNITHGQNREWEVGKYKIYDEPETRQSGTNLTM